MTTRLKFFWKPPSRPRLALWLVIVIALAAGIGGWALGDSDLLHWNKLHVHLGQRLVIDQVSVVAEQIASSTTSTPSGSVYQVVTVRVKNIHAKNFQIIPLLQFHLRDEQGSVYPITVYPSANSQWSGPLEVGDTLREDLAFLVPASAKHFTLYFEPGVSGQAIGQIALHR